LLVKKLPLLPPVLVAVRENREELHQLIKQTLIFL